MNIDDLLAEIPDDINYEELSAETLELLVRADYNQFTSTFALHQLNIVDKNRAFALSKDVIFEGIGDKFIKAQAIGIFDKHDRILLVNHFKNRLFELEQVELDTFVNIVWVDLDEFEVDEELLPFLHALAACIKKRGVNSFEHEQVEYVQDILKSEVLNN